MYLYDKYVKLSRWGQNGSILVDQAGLLKLPKRPLKWLTTKRILINFVTTYATFLVLLKMCTFRICIKSYVSVQLYSLGIVYGS